MATPQGVSLGRGELDELAALRARTEAARAAARERQRRHRERESRTIHIAASPGATIETPSRPFPVHSTQPLERIGTSTDDPAYQRAPIEGVTAPPPPVDPNAAKEAAAGAAKIAMIVAFMFRQALADGATRFELAAMLTAQGIPAAQVDAWLAGAVAHVYGCTERSCIKHGLGISLPYEDEVTAIGAGLGSALYLWARHTGRLDRLTRREQQAEPEAPRARVIDIDDLRNPDGTLRDL